LASIYLCLARRAVRLPVLVLALLALVVAACGVSGTGGAPASTQGMLSGKVVARPTCPVERAEQPCQPAPITHRTVSIENASGKVVASVTTDPQGQFSVALAPGQYVVRVAIVRGQPGLRQLTPGSVTVFAGKTTPITITLDTGIRSPSTR